ncbi:MULTISPECIES: DUF6279 family lipoprotein [unclassified Janthinobacterium]|uniref:DUF6279 family lipoprotein n=1 Tax=unclassified Janthinobacterium TaxID=2610881 RepID=UPI00161E6597|nr:MULTISPECIES: DUF6279 family lipoprotein [unclassified Janthinobacterium]MBB5370099.1 hypothetical protein [Janthinobacterium sp. K2C7]MBB5382905.1 hypothetical protein [Janthinobacterium sp. K2Li3]MBB5388616.1 hypothetical protein [Janthinobacterium sp. K2E3]
MKNFNTQAPYSRRFTYAVLALLLAAMTACSGLRLAYNNGDTVLYWWLNAYVDLDRDQKDWVRDDIGKLFDWHRKTQLKDYVEILRTGQKQLQGNVTQADLIADYAEVKQRTQTLLLKAAPELADLARSLKPEQIVQMEKKFKSNNDDYRKKYLSGDQEQRQKLRYKKAMEQFELWFGSFSSEQEAVLRKASDARPLDNAIWLDERMRRQQNVLTLVKKVQQEKLSKDATVTLINGLIKDSFERLEHSERKAFFDAYENSTAQFVLTAIQLATPAQKAHAIKRMQGWIDDFNSLATQAK